MRVWRYSARRSIAASALATNAAHYSASPSRYKTIACCSFGCRRRRSPLQPGQVEERIAGGRLHLAAGDAFRFAFEFVEGAQCLRLGRREQVADAPDVTGKLAVGFCAHLIVSHFIVAIGSKAQHRAGNEANCINLKTRSSFLCFFGTGFGYWLSVREFQRHVQRISITYPMPRRVWISFGV